MRRRIALIVLIVFAGFAPAGEKRPPRSFIKHDAELVGSLIPVLYRIGVADLGIEFGCFELQGEAVADLPNWEIRKKIVNKVRLLHKCKGDADFQRLYPDLE